MMFRSCFSSFFFLSLILYCCLHYFDPSIDLSCHSHLSLFLSLPSVQCSISLLFACLFATPYTYIIFTFLSLRYSLFYHHCHSPCHILLRSHVIHSSLSLPFTHAPISEPSSTALQTPFPLILAPPHTPASPHHAHKYQTDSFTK